MLIFFFSFLNVRLYNNRIQQLNIRCILIIVKSVSIIHTTNKNNNYLLIYKEIKSLYVWLYGFNSKIRKNPRHHMLAKSIENS